MKPQPRFTLARDGTSLAYRVQGEGPAIVFTNGYATSDFYWEHLVRHFAKHATVVTWDLKGHGRSGPAHSLEACTIADSVDDLRRVLDAADIERATLVGFSLGCQIVLEAWRQIPERIEAIVPILGTYGRPFDYLLLSPVLGRATYRMFCAAGPRAGDAMIRGAYLSMRTPLAHLLNQMFGMVGRGVSKARMQPFYDHFAHIDPPTWVAMGIAAQQHSAEDLLETIAVPVLVVAGGRDLFTPQHLSREMHRRIPRAELLLLPQATHAGLLEYPDAIEARLDAFLRCHAILRPRAA